MLASFIISGDCPKCGRVVTKGHKKHLGICSGSPQQPQTLLADMIEAEMTKIATHNRKLQQLELGGLIEFDDEHAVFMVIGSKGTRLSIFTGWARSPFTAHAAVKGQHRFCTCTRYTARKQIDIGVWTRTVRGPFVCFLAGL